MKALYYTQIIVSLIFLFSVVSALEIENHEILDSTAFIFPQLDTEILSGHEVSFVNVISNIAYDSDVLIENVRLLRSDGTIVDSNFMNVALPPMGHEWDSLRAIDPNQVPIVSPFFELLTRRITRYQTEIVLNSIVREYRLDLYDFGAPMSYGDTTIVRLEVDFNRNGIRHTYRRDIVFEQLAPFPDQGNWFRGDGHVHSSYSGNPIEIVTRLDRFFTFKQILESIRRNSEAAKDAGLRWVIFTDHSTDLSYQCQLTWDALNKIAEKLNPAQGVTRWVVEQMVGLGFSLGSNNQCPTPEELFNDHAKRDCAQVNHSGQFVCSYGQEVSLDAENDFPYLDIINQRHYLVYNSTYIDSTCRWFDILNFPFIIRPCKDAQVAIDEVRQSGGLGFIAHPHSTPWSQFPFIGDSWRYWDTTGFESPAKKAILRLWATFKIS